MERDQFTRRNCGCSFWVETIVEIIGWMLALGVMMTYGLLMLILAIILIGVR